MMANMIPTNRDMRVNDFFGDVFSNFWQDDSFKVDIKENDDNFEVAADLPGFDKKDIHVNYDNDVLSIQASHEHESEDQDEESGYIRKERSSYSQSRQFMLKNIDEDKISAEYVDGVLNITLPKAKENDTERKQIEIK